jgi:hypothetical protein
VPRLSSAPAKPAEGRMRRPRDLTSLTVAGYRYGTRGVVVCRDLEEGHRRKQRKEVEVGLVM